MRAFAEVRCGGAKEDAVGNAAYYILVDSTTAAMGLYRALRQRGCQVRVAPVPRGVTACCGTSLMVEPDQLPAVQATLDADPPLAYQSIVRLDNAIDPNRNVFC